MSNINIEELLGKIKDTGSSLDAMPPTVKNGRQHIIVIADNKDSKEITIHHHTLAEGEVDKEKIRNPQDSKSITIPYEALTWFAPRLEGYRSSLGIENSFDKYSKK